jgi:gluconokinase
MQSITITDAIHPLVLTLDVGTSAVRLLCFDAQARQITGIDARRPIDVYSDAHGAAEINITKLCLQCDAVIEAVIAQLGSYVQFVSAIGVDTMATTMIGIASDGTPVGPLRTYADTQSAGAA